VHRHTGRATVHGGGLASACVLRRSSGEKAENFAADAHVACHLYDEVLRPVRSPLAE